MTMPNQSTQQRPVPTARRLIPAVLKAVAKGDCIAIVGAGMSMPGCPSARALAFTVANACDLTESEESLAERRVFGLAQLKEPDEYLRVLKAELKDKFENDNHNRYALLMRSGFRAIVSLNLDYRLVRTIQGHYPDTCWNHERLCTDLLSSRTHPNILFPHGNFCYEKPRFVMTDPEFKAAYSEYSDARTLFSVIFREYAVVFLGCGRIEPEILKIAKGVHDDKKNNQQGGWEPRWFWVVGNEERSGVDGPTPMNAGSLSKIQEVKDAGILDVVLDSEHDPGFGQLDELLKKLVEQREKTNTSLAYRLDQNTEVPR